MPQMNMMGMRMTFFFGFLPNGLLFSNWRINTTVGMLIYIAHEMLWWLYYNYIAVHVADMMLMCKMQGF